MVSTINNQAAQRLQRRKRAMLWSLFLILGAALILPMAGYVGGVSTAQAATEQYENPRANYWREVREGAGGYTAVSGQEANVLIQGEGQNWRSLRNGPIANYGGWLLALVVLALGTFYVTKGQVKLDSPRSGQTIERWSGPERLLHWYTAILFIILAITGLSLLFGRVVLIPVLGKEGFAGYASLAKTLHNYLGPLFMVGVILMFVSWVKDNGFTKVDKEWFKQGGGILRKGHPSAGRFNGGEKVWFWIVCVVGMVVSITGLVMDFPNFGQERDTMQLVNLIHGGFALVFMAVSMGHIYIGTIGSEGSLEGMVSGEVDVAWAKQHHDLWYEEVLANQGQNKPVAEEVMEETPSSV